MGLREAVRARLIPRLAPKKAAADALPSTVPAPAGPRRGLAMLASDAAREGISTGTTFRVDNDTSEDDDEDHAHAPIANGTRDRVIGVSYDAEIRYAVDGTPFWGPVDNESSRARAAGRHLAVDQEECIACGTCVEHIDGVFELPDGQKARAYRQEGAMDRVQGAIDACPVTCIAWHDKVV